MPQGTNPSDLQVRKAQRNEFIVRMGLLISSLLILAIVATVVGQGDFVGRAVTLLIGGIIISLLLSVVALRANGWSLTGRNRWNNGN